MILHTDFHDYYDTAIGYGIDKNVHYDRHTKEIESSFNRKLPSSNRFYVDYYRVTMILIGFCGELFPVVRSEKLDGNRSVLNCSYFYTVEELLA